VVAVQTSTLPGAGTTANVTLRLRGAGAAEPQHFELTRDCDDFARGKLQAFEIFFEGSDDVSDVWLGHDGYGALHDVQARGSAPASLALVCDGLRQH
jgi:lipoxygenase homology domain-containing protein 1